MSVHVQRAKGDPEAQRKFSLSDCTWLENENGSFNLEALNFLMHFREPGEFTLRILIFFSFFSSFFLSFILFLIHSFFLSYIRSRDFHIGVLIFYFPPLCFFNYSPLNSKIAPYLPPPPCLDVARPRAKRR
jgi:hypothetical protein